MLAFNHLGKLGQLGNQMFQYAALKGISAHKRYDWCIPNHKNVFVDAFGNKLKIELFECFNLLNLKPHNLSILDNGYAPIVQEKFFHFDEELYNLCPNDVSLSGYFQSEKWFKNIENEIRDDFSFREEIFFPCKEMIDQIDSPISLHIRRGDFLENSENHFNLDLDYYAKGLSLFESDRNVIIFSDDPEWCKQQKLFSADRFMISESDNSYVDLCLMTLCSDFIIANSTFSWWGSWLCNNYDKKIIAPSKWFGPNLKNNSTKDLILKDWVVI
jgi:hypothetical protein